MPTWEEIEKQINDSYAEAKVRIFFNKVAETVALRPIETLIAVGMVVSAVSSLIGKIGAARGSHAYARQVNYRIKGGK